MKLSKREIVMLAVLIIIAIVFIEFRLIITPGIANISKLSVELTSLEADVDEINLNLASIDSLTKTRDKNLAEIDTLSIPFLNGIKPDVLLLFMHDLMQTNLFTPDGYSISTVETAILSADAIEISKLAYQLSDLADQYHQLQSPETSEPSTEPQAQVAEGDGTVELFSIHVTAVGSYAQVISLIDQIKSMNRTMTFSSFNLYYLDVDQLQIDLTLQFVGITKITSATDDLTIWTRPEFDGGIEDPYGNIVTPNETVPNPSETTAAP